MGPRPPHASFDARVGSRTGRNLPMSSLWEGAPPDPPALLALASSTLPLSPLCPTGYSPLMPSPHAQCPSPLAAVHHPADEVPGVGAAVSQRASGPGELQKVTGALGMHDIGQQHHCPSAGASPQPHGARGHPTLGLAAQPNRMSWFPLGLCKAPRLRTKPPSPLPWTPAHSLPPLSPQPPRSPLASHLGRAVSSRGAAGPLGPVLQEAAVCPEGTGRDRGSLGGDRGSPAAMHVWMPTKNILLPRAWSCASTPRAAGCRWRPSTLQPSWYGCWGQGESPGVSFGCSPGRASPGCGPIRVLDHHLSSSPQSLDTHLALCSATSRKLIQKYFSNRIQQQVGVRMVPPAPSYIPPLHTRGASHPRTREAAQHSLPVETWDFPTTLPVLGLLGLVLPQRWAGGGSVASQRMPITPPVPPKCQLSLHWTPGIPSMSVLKGSTLILVPHCSAGHQLGEVRGRDDQSAVPPFGAETPRGSAQRRQPHPAGLQRWVWVGWGAPPPRDPLSSVPYTLLGRRDAGSAWSNGTLP